MSRPNRLALAVTLAAMLSACQPAVSQDVLLTPPAGNTGALRVEEAADATMPPVIVFDPTGEPSRFFGSHDRDDQTVYVVITNSDGHYSVWPARLVVPRGWTAVDKSGTKAECLAYIESIYLDQFAAHSDAMKDKVGL